MPQPSDSAPHKKLLIFFGTTASGKSFLAEKWAASHNYLYLNTDIIRKKLAVRSELNAPPQGIEQGIYSREFTRLTYDTILNEAETAFLSGQAVVAIDGSYIKRTERDRIRARLCDLASCLFIHCVCSEATVKKRLASRAEDQSAVSDGTWEIYLHQQQVLEPPTELEPEHIMTLNTELSLAELMEMLDRTIGSTSP